MRQAPCRHRHSRRRRKVSTDLVIASLATAFAVSTPILIAACGELLAEETGIYNIGIEGSMLFGALAGFIGGQQSGQVLIALLAALVFGGLAALVFGIAVVILRADIVVAGLALVFIGLGLTGMIGADYQRQPAQVKLGNIDIPVLKDIPALGEILFQQSALTYFAFLLPVAVWFLLFRTRHGLNMRAIGEDPVTADVTGINVNGWRIFYVTVGGGLAGVGGAYLTLDSVGTWQPDVTSGQGYIALAVVVLANWRPLPLIGGALLFGILGTVGDVAQALGSSIPASAFSALPYVGTLVVVCLVAWLRRSSWHPWPSALGTPFLRGAG